MITICVFAKPPAAGEVKTRLAASIGAAPAAELARAFLADTWALVSSLPWARPVIASTGPLPGFPTVWPQGEGTLDDRLERVLRRALAETPAGAIALGADSPGLPRALLDRAGAALERGETVLGPARDGGFYLLGLTTYPPGLLAQIPWSTATTAHAVTGRLTTHGMPPHRLDEWFDVDRAEDLPQLRALLASMPGCAPATAAALIECGLA